MTHWELFLYVFGGMTKLLAAGLGLTAGIFLCVGVLVLIIAAFAWFDKKITASKWLA